MPHRASSPAISENEFDISKALFDDNHIDGDEEAGSGRLAARSNDGLDIGKELDVGRGEDEDSGDEAFIAAQQAASNRKASNLKGKTVKKGGGFQAMGLNTLLLKAITRKGFSVPTPIQRKTIPLVLDNQDVVGMARTGSGKTAAFVIPVIEKLRAHSAKVGARAVVLSPSRELALQTLKVVKELGRGTDLRTILLVGGDSLEDQFSSMASNPDIIIATPGRFLHLKVEMGLDLSSVRYAVFDEADRLFEMGFAAQLSEILHALPASRQTLLFSATLPKSLVEFARAGLQEPKLVRLDAESKVSPDLESAFFTVKSAEKEGALLHILHDIIRMPVGETEAAKKAREPPSSNSKKRKRGSDTRNPTESPTEHSTIIFAATKHHVEYLTALLRLSGYAVSHVYGSLDQTARKMQVEDFRAGMTNILVVTDVAARGIDIPVLANVINYDFPSQPKIFVHRVGRTARAGRKGWSYSLVRDSDVPYLLDLQLFLSKRLVLGREAGENVSFAEDVVVGSLVRDRLERSCEWVAKLLDEDADLAALRVVAAKGEKLYVRTRNSASSESAKRAKDVLANRSHSELNILFNEDEDVMQLERERMLARISGFRPQETVFEIGKRGSGEEAAEIMRKRREKIDPRRRQEAGEATSVLNPPVNAASTTAAAEGHNQTLSPNNDDDDDSVSLVDADMSSASSDDLEITFSEPTASKKRKASDSYRDAEHFMSYTPSTINLAEDRAYGVHSGSYNPTSSASANNFLTASTLR